MRHAAFAMMTMSLSACASPFLPPAFLDDETIHETIRQRAARPAPVQEPASLEQLVEHALAANPGLHAARQRIETARWSAAAAFAQHFGRLDLTGKAVTFGSQDDVFMNGLLVDVDRWAPGTFDTMKAEWNDYVYGVGADLRIPLYLGGRIESQVRLAEITGKMMEDLLRAGRDETVFNVTSVYYSILRFQKDREAARKSVERLKESEKNLDAQVKAGTAVEADLLKVRARLRAVEQDVIRAENAVKVSYGMLNVLLGNEDVTRTLKLVDALGFFKQDFDMENSMREALLRRPELLAKEKAVKVQAERVEIARAAGRPQIGLFARYDYYGAEESDLFDQVSGGIELRLPLLDGGVIRSRVSEERSRQAEAQAQVDEFRLSVLHQVQTAYLAITEAEKRVVAAQAGLDAAREVLRVEEAKVKEGKGIVENLLDAQAAHLQAEFNYISAVADYNVAVAAFKRAVGSQER